MVEELARYCGAMFSSDDFLRRPYWAELFDIRSPDEGPPTPVELGRVLDAGQEPIIRGINSHLRTVFGGLSGIINLYKQIGEYSVIPGLQASDCFLPQIEARYQQIAGLFEAISHSSLVTKMQKMSMPRQLVDHVVEWIEEPSNYAIPHAAIVSYEKWIYPKKLPYPLDELMDAVDSMFQEWVNELVAEGLAKRR